MTFGDAFRSAAAFCFFLFSAGTASAQFTFQTFTIPGAEYVYAGGLNNNGDAAGLYYTALGGFGYLRASGGTLSTFDLSPVCPDNCEIEITAINDSGQIAGDTAPSVNPVGFIRNPDGTYNSFPPPPGWQSLQVLSLNNAGETTVLLIDYSAPYSRQMTVRSPQGVYTPLPAPPAGYGPVTGALINNNGLIAGTVGVPATNTSAGFILNPTSGQYTIFDYSAAPFGGGTLFPFTEVTGLNDEGAVIGLHAGLLGNEPYIRRADGSVDSFIPALSYQYFYGLSINSAGQIAGSNSNGGSTPAAVGFVGNPSSDMTPPEVSVAGIAPGPPEQVTFSVVDPVSGIFNIVSSQANCTVSIGKFTPGQTTPVTVTATRLNQGEGSQVGILAVDGAGNVTEFDPEMMTIQAGGAGIDSLSGIPASEHILTISNGAPGLTRLNIRVNGRLVAVHLQANEQRTVNLQPWMALSANDVSFSGIGPASAQASVILRGAGGSTAGSRSGITWMIRTF